MWRSSKDAFGPDGIHEFKVNKYDKLDIHRWMKQNNPIADTGSQKGLITVLLLNWSDLLSLASPGSFGKHMMSQEDCVEGS